MNRFLLLLTCFWFFLFSNDLFAQEQESHYPRILIVSPGVFEYDEAFESEITKIQEYVRNYGLFKDDLEKHPPNIRRTMESVISFSKNSSAKGILPLFITERMLFTMFRGKRNFVFLMDTCKIIETGDALQQLAHKYDVQHIIYFPQLKLTKSGELGKGFLSLRVYNTHSNSISMTAEEETNWDYDEEDENPELVRDKTAVALIHNVSFPLWFRILTNIYDTNESYAVIKDQMDHSQEENNEETYEVFYEDNDEEKYIKEGLSKCVKQVRAISPDLKTLNQILQTKANPYTSASVFQVIFNQDKSRFIAFCMDSVQSPNALTGYIKKDSDVAYYCSKFGLISSSKAVKGNTFYGSLIRGIKWKDHWFFDQVSYSKFDNKSKEDCQTILLANLYYWGYLDTRRKNLFDDDDGLFGSPNRFQDGRFPYEGLQLWNEEKGEYELPDYLSFIEINDRIRETKEFEARFRNQLLKPFYKQVFGSVPDEKALLFYSPDRKKVIHPYFDAIQNKMRYFLFAENSVFEWKYFDNSQIQWNSSDLREQIISQFNKVTTFDYGDYLVLGDEQFWNTYVFSKDAGSYKFLSEIRM